MQTRIIPIVVSFGGVAEKMQSLSINQLSEGQTAMIAKITGDKSLVRKMIGLGLRVGSEVCLLQHRRQGCVLANRGTRIALGECIASQISVIPC